MIDVSKYLTNKDVIAVALSGGKDSMALIDILYNSLGNKRVKAINVEHGIRGQESLQDTLFVKNYCEKHNIELKCYSVDCVKFSLDNGFSLEEGARIKRYECFLDAIKTGFCDKVATAHHLTDSAETILFNLFRGSGSLGVSGIDSRDYIIRPLIDVSRQEIDQYVDKKGILYVQDSTNSNDDYTRNYIRNNLFPLIKNRFPEAEKALGRFAKISKIQQDYINEIAKKELSFNNGEISFKKDLAKAIKYQCVILCLKYLGLEKDYEFKHCLEVDKLDERKNGDEICFPKGIRCVKDYGKITFFKVENTEQILTNYTIGEIDLSNSKVVISKEKTDKSLMIDADKLPSDCVIRTRQEGDKFTPFSSGEKKLKKYLIDKKIPKRYRDKLLVVANKQEVFIVIGIEISDKIKITDNTKNIHYIKQIFKGEN